MKAGLFLQDVQPVGGEKKTHAAEEIINRVGTDFSAVIYIGDSITDVECFRLIKQNGGLTISFNGNKYAVREAEIAVISSNALPMAAIARIFANHGREAVYKLVDQWEPEKLREFDINSTLIDNINHFASSGFFKTTLINEENLADISSESSSFRKLVRGEEIGNLG
jgi:energy-converting hydrogenase A subunit R